MYSMMTHMMRARKDNTKEGANERAPASGTEWP